MVNESVAIVAVFTLASITIVRAKKSGYLLLILPIFLVPVFYLIPIGLGRLLTTNMDTIHTISWWSVVAAGVVGSIAVFVLSHFIPSYKGKISYTIFGILFSLGLMAAYLVNIT